MAQQTRKQLLAQLAQLKAENTQLKTNPNYGTLTRQAGELEFRKLGDKAGLHVVMIDIDFLHMLNQKFGSQIPVNAMIRTAFQFRHNDLLLKANYSSGDEVYFIVRGNPAKFMLRLQRSLIANGLSATMASEPIVEDNLAGACDMAIAKVYALKVERNLEVR